MIAILWKELRENLPWALLAVAGLIAGQLYVLSTLNTQYFNNWEGFTVTNKNFLMVVRLSSIFLAVALALLQILPERQRDTWATLLHRPMSRRFLLLAKALAGLLLYLLATGLPLLVSTIYVAWPGQFAIPFFPGLLVPAIQDVAFGFVFYCLTLLICLERAWWLGRRGVLVLAGLAVFTLGQVAGSFLNFSWMYFPLSRLEHWFGTVLSYLFCAGVFLLAACGAISHESHTENRRWWERLAFAFSVFLGVSCLIALLAMAGEMASHRVQPYQGTSKNFAITKTGEILFQTYTYPEGITNITELDGTPIPIDPNDPEKMSYAHMLTQIPLSFRLDKPNQTGWSYTLGRSIQGATTQYVICINDHRIEGENWFYLPQKRYFVGYSRETRLPIMVCDVEGFHDYGKTPTPFPEPLQTANYANGLNIFFYAEEQVYFIRFLDHTFRPIYNTEGKKILGAASLQGIGEDDAVVAVALPDRVHYITEQGEKLVAISYPHDIKKLGMVNATLLPDMEKFYLHSQPDFYKFNQEKNIVYLDSYDGSGNLLKSYSYNRNIMVSNPGWISYLTQLLAPTLLNILIAFRYWLAGTNPAYGFLASWMTLAYLAWGALWAVLCWRECRQACFSRGRTLRWTSATMLLGVIGYLTFRFAASPPIQVRCPSCQRRRPLSLDKCPHCEAGWEEKQRTGAHIHEPVAR